MSARVFGRCLGAMLVLALFAAAGALALPGDPPIEPLSPADGATVSANPDGIAVTYRCPAYRKEMFGDPANPTVSRGDSTDYQVRFSASSGLGPNGLLAEQSFGSDDDAQADPAGTTCTSTLIGNGAPNDPTRVGGRVFWQAYRSCIGCDGQRPESAPVRSFVARASVTAKLGVPKRLYASYLGVFTVRSKARLVGARVKLQRRAGRRWRTFANEPYRTDATELIASLPAGRQRIRGLITTAGSSFNVAPRTLTVRRGGRRRTSRRDDGRYTARKKPPNSTLSFRVAGGGRTLRKFKASVTTFCFGPSFSDNAVSLAFAVLGTVRVAPDGSIVGLLKTRKGVREVLRGRLRKGRFVGEVSVSFSTCSGTRKLDAVLRGR